MSKDTATKLAAMFEIQLGKNFFTLSPSEVCRVLEAADCAKYHKPKNANGSRGRYFYDALNRAANHTQ